jgi:hypothetical protein
VIQAPRNHKEAPSVSQLHPKLLQDPGNLRIQMGWDLRAPLSAGGLRPLGYSAVFPPGVMSNA